jgi:4-hydroxy-3-methylbut-2-en-1-yl diphosphate synthase IspG/GcpE
MVESALEFVRICREYDFHEIVLSMKSSVARVAIEANRLLVERMAEEGMDYPIHLGVTEAGAGLSARLKSAIGIGGLLGEGIGDTIRVSLTEPSINEIEACRQVLLGVARTEPGFIPYLTDDLRERLGESGAPIETAHTQRVWTMPRPTSFADREPARPLKLGPLPLGGSDANPIRVHYQALSALDDPDALLRELHSVAAQSTTQESDDAPEAIWIRGLPNAAHLEKALNGIKGSTLENVPVVFRTRLKRSDSPEGLADLLGRVEGVALSLARIDSKMVSSTSRLVQKHHCALLLDAYDNDWGVEGDAHDPQQAVSLCQRFLKEGLDVVGLVISAEGLRRRAWEIHAGLCESGMAERVVLVVEPRGTPSEQALAAGPTLLETTGVHLLPLVRKDAVRPGDDDGKDPPANGSPQRGEDRRHGVHCERPWRDGGRGLWLRGIGISKS